MGDRISTNQKSKMQASANGVKHEGGGDIGTPVDSNTQRSREVDVLKYDMNNPKRGRFIIINNENFEESTGLCEDSKRKGTDVDAESLKSVFGGVLGFDVVVKKDLTRAEMLQLMIAESSLEHGEYDCFGVAVLTHGTEGKLYGRDELITIESLVAPIKNCTSLAGKPKLFFFQACRGQKFDDGVLVTVQSDSPDALPNARSRPKQKQILLPLEADFLYAYSTVPGYYAWRNKTEGSWFVQALTKKLKNLAYADIDLVRILTRVNHQVAYEFESSAKELEFSNKKEVPSIVSMLTKDLYFTKKLASG